MSEPGTDRISLDLPAGRIAALTAGPPDGASVLLVAGYTGSKEDFAAILTPLSAAGFRAVAIDLPGQFESPGPTDPDAYTPDRLAGCLLDVADELGGAVHLVGHSFGGLVARAAVIAQPQRFSSLVLLSSGPAQLGGVRRVTIEQLQPVLAASGLPGVYAAMQAAAAADPGYTVVPPDVAEFLQRRFLGSSPAMLQGMGDALRHEPDRVAELATTGVRILVAHGVDDDAWDPATQRKMAERLNAEYVVIPGAAHSAAAENPRATAEALIEFLRTALPEIVGQSRPRG